MIRVALPGRGPVSALLTEAPDPFTLLVLAHGAGAGMHHPFMQAIAESLAQRGVSVLRYQFPFMEAGSKRPDSPAVAHLAVGAAVATAAGLAGTLPLFAGGKSFGGRMSSQAQALEPLPGVRGLVFFGFPLHPAGRPSVERAEHLSSVRVPMLFVHGSRDTLADGGLLEAVATRLGPLATLHTIPGADHSFHVPARSGRTDFQILQDIADRVTAWMRVICGSG